MQKIGYNIVFDRRGDLAKGKRLGLVQIRATQDRKCRFFTTKVYLEKGQWDEKRMKVRRHPNADELTAVIHARLRELEARELAARQRGRAFALADFTRPQQPDQDPSFITFARQQLTRERAVVSATTYRKKLTILDRLAAFRPELTFEQLDYATIEAFDQHLAARGLSANTRHDRHKHVRKWINQAVRLGRLASHQNPYNDFKTREIVRKPVVLTLPELARLEALELADDDQDLVLVRDLFLLGVYTGRRFGDLVRITRHHLRADADGLVLEIEEEKTGKPIRLNLAILFPTADGPSKPERLLATYARTDEAPCFRITNQHANRQLKRLATLARIGKRLTFHLSRHTFATHLAARNLPAPVLQRILNHRKLETTMRYVNVSDQIVDDTLKKIAW